MPGDSPASTGTTHTGGSPLKRFLWVLLAAPLGAWAAGTNGAAPTSPPGGVDWKGQVLTATGSGAPNMRATSAAQARLGAERAAKLDALRNLLEQVKGVQLTSTKKVG